MSKNRVGSSGPAELVHVKKIKFENIAKEPERQDPANDIRNGLISEGFKPDDVPPIVAAELARRDGRGTLDLSNHPTEILAEILNSPQPEIHYSGGSINDNNESAATDFKEQDNPTYESLSQEISNIEAEMDQYEVDSPQRNELALRRQKLIAEKESLVDGDRLNINSVDTSDQYTASETSSNNDQDPHNQEEKTEGTSDQDTSPETSSNNQYPDNPDQPPVDPPDPAEIQDDNDEDLNPQQEIKYGYARANREDDRQKYSQLYANQKIEAQLEEGGRFKKGLKRFFKGRVLRRYYETKYMQEYDRLRQENGGYLEVPLEILRGVDPQKAKDISREASRATTAWMLSQDPRMTEYRREGESSQSITGDAQIDSQIRSGLKDLALKYASGQLDDDTIIAKRDELFASIDGLDENLFGKGIGFSDSIIELARSVKYDIDNGVSIDKVEAALDNMDLKGGFSRGSAEAKVRKSLLEQIDYKLRGTRIGGTAIGSSIMLGASIIYCVAGKGATSAFSRALSITGFGAIAGGVIAGTAEAGVFKREASVVRQESAYGYSKNPDTNPTLKAVQEAVVYASESAPKATSELRKYLDQNGQLIASLTGPEIINLAESIARIKKKIELADSKKIDLFTFTGVAAAPVERLDLTIALVEAEKALDDLVSLGGTISLPAAYGSQSTQQFNIGDAVNSAKESVESSIGEEVDQDEAERNIAYNELMARRVATAALIGSAAGFGIGTVVSELSAAVNPNVNGLFEQQQAGDPNTLLTSLIQGLHNGEETFEGSQSIVDTLKDSQGTVVIEKPGTALNFEVPSGFSAQFTADNEFTLLAGDGTPIQDVTFGPDGQISPASIEELKAKGLNLSQEQFKVDGPTKEVSSQSFIDYYQGKGELETTRIIDNATNSVPGLVGDHNELALHAAGENGNWRQSDGSIRVGLAGLNEGGSWNGVTGQSYNVPQALEEGRGKIMITANNAYQPDGNYQTFLFDVEKDPATGEWNAVIPSDHPVASWFGEGGSISDYHGPSLEQLQNPNFSNLDSRNSLAFVINESGGFTNDYVSVASIEGTGAGQYKTPDLSIVYKSTLTGIPTSLEGKTLPVIFPPVYWKRGVGSPEIRRGRYGYGNYQYGYGSEQEKEEILAEVSPRMKNGEKLSLATEGDWYKNNIEKLQGREYKDEVEALFDSNEDLKKLHDDTKALVLIPVGAAFESENIFKTLSMWAQQKPTREGNLGNQEFSILLAVNHLEGQIDDPEISKKIEKTRAEIQRAKAAFPKLKIIDIDFEIPQSLIDKRQTQAEGPGIIGDITRRLYDVAILAATEHVKKPSSKEDDILLIRSNVDIVGLSPVYVDRMLKASRIMEGADAFRGEMVQGVNDIEIRSKLPGLVIANAFSSFINRGRFAKNPETIWLAGTNFSIRASSLAAVSSMGSSQFAGAGSDDTKIGDRLRIARSSDDVIRYVGATIDSDPSRLIGAYLAIGGEPYASLDDGPGGYKQRTAYIPNNLKSESLEETCERSQRVVNELIRGMEIEDARIDLKRFFGTEDIFDLSVENGELKFKFNTNGELYIREVVQHKKFLSGESGEYLENGQKRGRLLALNRRQMGRTRKRWITR